ncbi:hypothetical protein DFQ27_005277 [Actinomortierella ambigua]|uniref:Uncharacterized protein n=1 Tax=Actinomortierella ambigua TaxID=1343610 RepID=A0A9P6Q0Q4_9FUNG|nr:hypothetical protein DFQ27_005277 [Actinomortierella ambigua]
MSSKDDDMIRINASVQAKESLVRNAAALEPYQDGSNYTYMIHTPTDEKLEKAVTFQVFVTIPRNLDALESLVIEGTNIEVSIGNINHTFIRHLRINNHRGDIVVENFYGETAELKNTITGSIKGKFSVARLNARAKHGKIEGSVHLLNTDDQQPPPKVICATTNSRIDIRVDGSDLFGPFGVEAKTQCASLDAKVLLASVEQRLFGNFINFGGPIHMKLSRNYRGRVEMRSHYGKLFIDEPEFVQIEGATMTVPSASDRKGTGNTNSDLHQSSLHASDIMSSNGSIVFSSRTSSQGTAMSWGGEDPHATTHHQSRPPMSPTSIPTANGDVKSISRTNSFHGSLSSLSETHGSSVISTPGHGHTSHGHSHGKKKKEKDHDHIITREMIGTIGSGSGLIIAKNSSGDIHLNLV